MKNGFPNPERPLRIGSRGSPLALAQAREACERLTAAHALEPGSVKIVVIRTSGDIVQDRPLSQIGGKGLFTKEIEDALLAKTIDIAVHSLKDMPTEQPAGLGITCVLPREDVRDAFVSHQFGGFDALPIGAVVGTSSLRRSAQILHLRPDLEIVEFRGNVQTRLKKLNENVAVATFLAVAGIVRLKLSDVPFSAISPKQMLPAVAQGAIAIEQRLDDEIAAALLEPINDLVSARRVAAERAFLKKLDGSCQTPIAGLAVILGDSLQFRGEIIRPDGSESHAYEIAGSVDDAELLGAEVAEVLASRAGDGFFS